MLRVAFAGTFPTRLEQPARRHLRTPCETVVASEADILRRLPQTDVLVTMGLTAQMARAAARLKLVQVPGAGLERIDRATLPKGVLLVDAYGHEVGIAEYVIGAMLTLTREFARLVRSDERSSRMAFSNRITTLFGIEHPILLTPSPPAWLTAAVMLRLATRVLSLRRSEPLDPS